MSRQQTDSLGPTSSNRLGNTGDGISDPEASRRRLLAGPYAGIGRTIHGASRRRASNQTASDIPARQAPPNMLKTIKISDEQAKQAIKRILELVPSASWNPLDEDPTVPGTTRTPSPSSNTSTLPATPRPDIQAAGCSPVPAQSPDVVPQTEIHSSPLRSPSPEPQNSRQSSGQPRRVSFKESERTRTAKGLLKERWVARHASDNSESSSASILPFSNPTSTPSTSDRRTRYKLTIIEKEGKRHVYVIAPPIHSRVRFDILPRDDSTTDSSSEGEADEGEVIPPKSISRKSAATQTSDGFSLDASARNSELPTQITEPVSPQRSQNTTLSQDDSVTGPPGPTTSPPHPTQDPIKPPLPPSDSESIPPHTSTPSTSEPQTVEAPELSKEAPSIQGTRSTSMFTRATFAPSITTPRPRPARASKPIARRAPPPPGKSGSVSRTVPEASSPSKPDAQPEENLTAQDLSVVVERQVGISLKRTATSSRSTSTPALPTSRPDPTRASEPSTRRFEPLPAKPRLTTGNVSGTSSPPKLDPQPEKNPVAQSSADQNTVRQPRIICTLRKPRILMAHEIAPASRTTPRSAPSPSRLSGLDSSGSEQGLGEPRDSPFRKNGLGDGKALPEEPFKRRLREPEPEPEPSESLRRMFLSGPYGGVARTLTPRAPSPPSTTPPTQNVPPGTSQPKSVPSPDTDSGVSTKSTRRSPAPRFDKIPPMTMIMRPRGGRMLRRSDPSVDSDRASETRKRSRPMDDLESSDSDEFSASSKRRRR